MPGSPPPDADASRREFVRRNTRLQRPPHVPELQLYLADEVTPIWQMTERELDEAGVPPPFWAFAWAGGQAVARYLLDHPAEVAGRRVLDFAAGSGICAIAAARCGARGVLASDIDPFCDAAIALNAAANGVRVEVTDRDLLAEPPPDVDLLVAGDVCYERAMAARVLDWLRAARDRGARVLVGDPGRMYLPRGDLVLLAEYDVPTTAELEDATVKRSGVYSLAT